MKEFTSTQLRVKSTDVYNEVHKSGAVAINHRDRPEMILITREVLDKSLRSGGLIRT